MKFTLSAATPTLYKSRNPLGTAPAGKSPEEHAEALAAALSAAGVPAKASVRRHSGHHQTGNVILSQGPALDALRKLDLDRVKSRPIVAKRLAEKPTEFGIFISASQDESGIVWGEAEVTIFYTVEGRPLTAMRKLVLPVLQYTT